MKRCLFVILCAALLLALPAAADVAYMPEDSFLEKHREDCSYVGRWYWTNGEEGYVLAHRTPDSAEATPLPNGGKYYISSVYKGKWGVLEYDPGTLENKFGHGSVSGWVDMAGMLADYSCQDFMTEHSAELVQTDEELNWDGAENIFAYKYPGSGGVTITLPADRFHGDPIPFSTCFTDPAGRRWGYCGYLYGSRDLWICIDDPGNDSLPPDENCVTIVTRPAAATAPPDDPSVTAEPEPTAAPTPAGKTVELTPAADEAALKQAAKDNRGSGPYVLAGAGGVVVIAAAVLAAALRKRRK